MSLPDRADVVVVGAGFSGLAAAVELLERGCRVVVLEARERVGGKVESSLDGLGRRVDSGGQFVADEMPRVRALAQRAGATLVSNAYPGDAATIPPRWHHEWDLGEATLEALSEAPAPPSGLDVTTWISSLQCSEGARAAIRSTTNGQLCMDHRLLGVAHVAHQQRHTPAMANELQYTVDRTMHALAEHLAATPGLVVECSTAVRGIDRTGPECVVTTDRGTVQARHVVVAIPPSRVTSIQHVPPLPDRVATAADAFVAGDVTKILLRYERPFWRAQGWNGTIRFATPAGLYVADASVGDAHALVVFIGGPLAAAWRALGRDRDAIVLTHVAMAFGDEAATPIDVVIREWLPDEWGAGGYSQFVQGTGEPWQVAELQHGLPRLSFAGTELADLFPGYVEGALRAGHRAAEQAHDALVRHTRDESTSHLTE